MLNPEIINELKNREQEQKNDKKILYKGYKATSDFTKLKASPWKYREDHNIQDVRKHQDLFSE